MQAKEEEEVEEVEEEVEVEEEEEVEGCGAFTRVGSGRTCGGGLSIPKHVETETWYMFFVTTPNFLTFCRSRRDGHLVTSP